MVTTLQQREDQQGYNHWVNHIIANVLMTSALLCAFVLLLEITKLPNLIKCTKFTKFPKQ